MDEETPTPYSVYSLVDGELGFDDAYESYDEACAVFASVVTSIRATADRWTEETVHLYDSHLGTMLAETCVPKTVVGV